MNIRKIKTTAVMTLTVCTLLTSFPTSAQDTPTKASVLDDLEAGEITFGKAAKPPVPNLSAALDPFGDLLLSLLSVSHDEFQKLQKLISDEASSSSEPKTKATSVQNYQLTNKQINSLAERVKSLVKEKQAQAFHSYRIARSDADFLFAEFPIAGGIQGELVCNDDGQPPHGVREDSLPDYRIEPPDVLLIELAENLRPTHALITAGELLIVQVNQAQRSTKDENLTSQQFDTIDGRYIVDTDGYLNLGPEYGKVQVAGQPLAEIQRRVEVHLKRFLKSPQVVVNLANPNTKQQIAGQHLVRPDGTVGLGIYGGCFVAEMTLLEAKGAIERHLRQHIHNPQISVNVHGYNSKFYYVISGVGARKQVFRLPATGNETVLDAIAQVEGLASAANSGRMWITRPNPDGGSAAQLLHVDWEAVSQDGQTGTNYKMFPGDRLHVGAEFVAALKFETDRTRNGNRLLAGQFRLKDDAPEEPIDVEFTVKPQEGSESPIGHMIAIPVEDRVWLLTLSQKRPLPGAGNGQPVTVNSASQSTVLAAETTESAQNLDVEFFEARASDLETIAKLFDQPIDTAEGDAAGRTVVIQLSEEQIETFPSIQTQTVLWLRSPISRRDPTESVWSFRTPETPGQNRWKVKPKTATVRVQKRKEADIFQHVVVELSDDDVKSFSHSIKLSDDAGVAFVAAKKDDDTYYVAAVQHNRKSQSAPSAKGIASHPPIPVQVSPEPSSEFIQYIVKGAFYEFNNEAIAELRGALAIDETSPAAWVISKSDTEQFEAFASQNIKSGKASALSRPRMTGTSGKSMQIQIGSEVPITVPAGGESTAIEFKPVGIGMEVTLTAVTADSDRLDWTLSNTNRDGDWSFVTRNISGASLLISGESIVVPLPTRNDGMHMVAVLNPARIVKGQDGPFAQKPVTQDQQFAILTEQFNQLMKSRQYAEAILIGQKATELQPDNPVAIIMVEKAMLLDQVAIIEKAKSRERLPTIKASNFEVETFDVESNPTVRCDVGYTVKLKHTSRIKAVMGFDSDILKVEPIQGDPNSVTAYSLTAGGTQIRIVDEHSAEYLVNVLSLEFSGLDVYLKYLFPNVDIEVWPIKGSVLLRGNVNSELQKEHVVAVAAQFYPSILNQLTIDPNSNALPLRTNQHVPTSDYQASQSVITISADSSSLIIPHKSTKLLSLPKRIHSVSDFNSELIKVEPVSGAVNSISINALENGATKMTLTDEDHRQYFVDIVVEDSVQELSLLVRRLYPDLDLSFFSVKGAILVRGAVESEVQCQQILDVVRQFSDYVLNQTHIVAPPAVTENKTEEPHESVMNTDGVQEIRNDIKALHSDVRELLQLLKARSTQKDQTDSEADLNESNL